MKRDSTNYGDTFINNFLREKVKVDRLKKDNLIIKNLNNSLDRVMIVGHNHAFTSIANMLGNKYIENLPTCGFVQLEFDEDSWKDITVGKTKMTVFPRDLKNSDD